MTDSTTGRAKRASKSNDARSSTPSTDLGRGRHARKQRGSRKKVVILATSGLIIVGVLVAGGWLGSRVLTAKSSLEEAQGLVGTVKDQASAMDFAGIGDTSKRLSELTSTAVEQTEDPTWRAAELIPVLGSNLTAVRELAETVDSIAHDTVEPLAAVASGLSLDLLKPVDGKLNIEPIVQLSVAMGPAATAFHESAVKAAAIDYEGTVGQVKAAGEKVNGMLATADPLIAQVNSMLAVAPGLLGADGPRKYLLIFENLAETTALGGTAAALSEVTVDNGAISISRQASSQDFPWRFDTPDNPVIPIDPGVAAVFNPNMYLALNLATSRPDFPTAAQIASAFWQQDIGGTPDGVISIDPLFLLGVLGVDGSADPGAAVGDRACASSYFFFRVMLVFIREA